MVINKHTSMIKNKIINDQEQPAMCKLLTISRGGDSNEEVVLMVDRGVAWKRAYQIRHTYSHGGFCQDHRVRVV